MSAQSNQRPQHPGRSITEGHFNQQPSAPGHYTPEVSPLDRFIHRNKLLQKQLKTDGGNVGTVGGAPVMVHNPYNPHMNPPAHPRHFGSQPDLQRPEANGPRDPPPDIIPSDRIVAPIPDDRPMSQYPRFSMATSDGSGGDRDSLVSDRDSSILSGFGIGQQGMALPPLQESARSPQHEQGFGRDSVQAVIGHASDRDSMLSNRDSKIAGQQTSRESLKPTMEDVAEEQTSPAAAPAPRAFAPGAIPPGPQTAGFPPKSMGLPMGPPGGFGGDGGDRGRGRKIDHSRSKSQPPLKLKRPPPGRQGAGDDHAPMPRGIPSGGPPPMPSDRRRQTPSPGRQGPRDDPRMPPTPGQERALPSPNRSYSERVAREQHGREHGGRERGATYVGPTPRPGPGGSRQRLSPSPSRQDPQGPPGPHGPPGGRRPPPRQGAVDEYGRRMPPRSGPPGEDRSVPPSQPGGRTPSNAYVPFTYKKSPTTPTTPGFGPPSRQGSAESGKFPPPSRVGSGSSDRLNAPTRRNSGDSVTSQNKYVPYRQNSSDAAETRARPLRQDSMESDKGRQGNRSNMTSPQPQAAGSILPMLAGLRAGSPEPMENEDLSLQRSLSGGLATLPERSPSAASDAPSTYSIGGTRTRPSFNFSRPMANRPSMDADRPSIDIPSPSSENIRNADALPTPISFTDEPDAYNSDTPAPVVIYSRFELPRGREPKRGDSVVFNDSFNVPSHDPGNPGANAGAAGRRINRARTPTNLRPPSPAKSPPNGAALQVDGSAQPMTPSSPRPPFLTADSRHASPSRSGAASTGTAPRSPRLPPAAPNMTPEEHLHLGLDLHEKGKSAESTYHFRLSAHGGHPTGMLFYALACRHGWGMRPNQKEGVMWLKQVSQLASSQVVDDENGITNVAFIEKQGRRAQFALSIYELGVSHLNGWGTEMDKGLAVNCFEIAGKWGDPDALSEAGFCYANGVGCRKDMKKAAKFYRQAEAKGVNMVGNSWIWKDKYLDDEDRAAKIKKMGGEPDQPAKKEGGFFHRKKSVV